MDVIFKNLSKVA